MLYRDNRLAGHVDQLLLPSLHLDVGGILHFRNLVNILGVSRRGSLGRLAWRKFVEVLQLLHFGRKQRLNVVKVSVQDEI